MHHYFTIEDYQVIEFEYLIIPFHSSKLKFVQMVA
jgi:hypothetical protein